jgi:hypothetical protein
VRSRSAPTDLANHLSNAAPWPSKRGPLQCEPRAGFASSCRRHSGLTFGTCCPTGRRRFSVRGRLGPRPHWRPKATGSATQFHVSFAREYHKDSGTRRICDDCQLEESVALFQLQRGNSSAITCANQRGAADSTSGSPPRQKINSALDFKFSPDFLPENHSDDHVQLWLCRAIRRILNSLAGVLQALTFPRNCSNVSGPRCDSYLSRQPLSPYH